MACGARRRAAAGARAAPGRGGTGRPVGRRHGCGRLRALLNPSPAPQPSARKIGLTPSWRCVQTTDGLDPTEATCACRLVPPVVRPAQRPVSSRRTGVLFTPRATDPQTPAVAAVAKPHAMGWSPVERAFMKSVLSAVLCMADKSPLNETAGLGAAIEALWGLERATRRGTWVRKRYWDGRRPGVRGDAVRASSREQRYVRTVAHTGN
jgi:hypothetical protein